MNKTIALFCSLLAVFSLAAPLSSYGGGKKAPPKPIYDAISSVDTSALTITVSHANSRDTSTKILKLTPQTEIEVNGTKATVGDLKAGMKISYTIAMDGNSAVRVVAGPAPTK